MKILKIESCYQCPFIRTLKRYHSECDHPCFANSTPIEYPNIIPAWCPLEEVLDLDSNVNFLEWWELEGKGILIELRKGPPTTISTGTKEIAWRAWEACKNAK